MDTATYLLLAALVVLVLLGVEVAVALGAISVLALFSIGQSTDVILNFLGSTAYEVLRDYVYAVVPLFILMGLFIARSGAASDLFWLIDRWLKGLPGCLAHATVLGNILFGFVTGTSVAAAITFTTIAYPEMKRFGYNSSFQLGLIAGSACLGMLIPPSVLLVIWAILTDQSIGQLFLAGIVPGFLLAFLMMAYIVIVGWVRPEWVGRRSDRDLKKDQSDAEEVLADVVGEKKSDVTRGGLAISGSGLLSIVVFSLGGIWFGFLTPTEGSGVGALLALVVGLFKGMRWKDVQWVILETGRVAIPILAILFTAQLYARTLAMSGIGATIEHAILTNPFGEHGSLILMVGIWFILGMLIDSISIMLLTVPIFAPVAAALNIDPIVFAIIGVLVIEAGLLTPPFGINVYAVRGAVNSLDVSMGSIFLGVTPYWIMLIALVPLFYVFPVLIKFLPNLM